MKKYLQTKASMFTFICSHFKTNLRCLKKNLRLGNKEHIYIQYNDTEQVKVELI